MTLYEGQAGLFLRAENNKQKTPPDTIATE